MLLTLRCSAAADQADLDKVAAHFDELKEAEDEAMDASDGASECSDFLDPDLGWIVEEEPAEKGTQEWAASVIQASIRGRSMRRYRALSQTHRGGKEGLEGFAKCTAKDAEEARSWDSYHRLHNFLLDNGCASEEVERCTDIHELRLFLREADAGTLRQQVLHEIVRSEAEYLRALYRLQHCFILPIDQHFQTQLLEAAEVMAPTEWEEFKRLVSKLTDLHSNAKTMFEKCVMDNFGNGKDGDISVVFANLACGALQDLYPKFLNRQNAVTKAMRRIAKASPAFRALLNECQSTSVTIHLHEHSLIEAYDIFDTDGDNLIGEEEFFQLGLTLKPEGEWSRVQSFKVFSELDEDGSGTRFTPISLHSPPLSPPCSALFTLCLPHFASLSPVRLCGSGGVYVLLRGEDRVRSRRLHTRWTRHPTLAADRCLLPHAPSVGQGHRELASPRGSSPCRSRCHDRAGEAP